MDTHGHDINKTDSYMLKLACGKKWRKSRIRNKLLLRNWEKRERWKAKKTINPMILKVRDSTLGEMRQWLRSQVGNLHLTWDFWINPLFQAHIHNCRTDANFLLRFLRMQKFRCGEADTIQLDQLDPEWSRAVLCLKSTFWRGRRIQVTSGWNIHHKQNQNSYNWLVDQQINAIFIQQNQMPRWFNETRSQQEAGHKHTRTARAGRFFWTKHQFMSRHLIYTPQPRSR